ncbi:hypothetical protein PABG_12242 [Paracoccidioides brasiliensis Pb03]|nr:hypothetical protein PABG_12242 [Paracoccidioides brasiliensis Pb03]
MAHTAYSSLFVTPVLFRSPLLLQILAIQAQDAHDETRATTDISNTFTPSETRLPDELRLRARGKGKGADGETSGQPSVEAALNILRSVNVPANRHDRPSGFLGYTKYYAREAFYLLFMNRPHITVDGHSTRGTDKLSPELEEAVLLLQDAVNQDHPDAIFLLAEMNFYGNFTHPRNYTRAFELYKTLATLEGNSSAQYMVGFMYATGIGGAVERHQGQALLYHTFAAMGGNIRSQMTVAFRRYLGIGAPRDCDQAALYYKQVADQAMAYYRSGPPGGQMLIRESYNWADDEGGVYGEGASVSSSGANANRDGQNSGSDASLEDVLEYLDLLSKKGDVKATFSLGKMYYEGSKNLKRNVRRAMRYFGLVAKKYWTKDGKIISSHPVGIEKTAAKAAAHIGLMFLRGEGTEQNFEKALTWFQRGIPLGDPMCQHYMGLMYLNGYGVPKDGLKAAAYFKAASEQDFPASETRLGALFLDQGDVATATRYFELAARYGWIEAFYYLAEIAEKGIGKERHCGVATAYYKMVAEKVEAIHSSFHEANTAYENGDKETALVASMMAAEQGYENAQANVAYLLDEQRSVLPLDSILPRSRSRRPSLLRNAALALIYWTRSGRQANTDSLVKMGDYYFYGYGTPPDLDKAFTCYHSAAEGYHSAQAFWNLGWMHENGYATEQDFHMAKRFYDLALETNYEAYLPVKLSLIKLRIRSFWNKITHGNANPIRTEPDAKPHRSFKEWITAFITYDEEENEDYHKHKHKPKRQSNPDNPDGVFSEDGTGTDAMDEKVISDQDKNFYNEYDIDFDDEFFDGFVILLLAVILVILVYVRQQRALRRGRQENQNAANGRAPAGIGTGQPANNPAGTEGAVDRQQRQEDRGLFPQPDDPEFAAWVAGGKFRAESCCCSAKRRRIDQATSTLFKPFKSPLRKQLESTSTDNSGKKDTESDPKAATDAPNSPDTSDKLSSRTQSEVIKKPTTIPPAPPPTASPSSPSVPLELITLQRKHSALTSRLITLRAELDSVNQALKVEQSGQDAELEVLIAKWKAASREAAEELFVSAEKRVERMGGVKGWKERMRQAQEKRARWDEDVRAVGDREDLESEWDEEVERKKAEMETDSENVGGGNNELEDEDESFTMDMMLKSLNVELDIIGFDKDTQQWT